MIPWRLIPFVRIAVVFLLGIWSERFLPDHSCHIIVIAVLLFVYCGFKDFVYTDKKELFSFYAGLLYMLLFFNLGYIRSFNQNPSLDPCHYMHHVERGTKIIGIVQEVPIFRSSYRTEVEIEYICDDNGHCVEVNNKAVIYFHKKDNKAKQYKPGDRIVILAKLEAVSKSTNPHAFNFKSYLWNRGITHQAFVWKACHHYLVDSGRLNPLMQLAMDSRAAFLGIFNKYIKDADENAILSAMVLGYRNMVSDDMYKAFSDTGSVHILAVSGMHLVFLVAMIEWVFRVLKYKNKKVKWIITTILMWFFSLITGAAPAILRAAIMFTVILYGRAFKSMYNMYNILAFCALVMLIWDPYLLYQASFQFSFVSLLSLAYFQPYITSWFLPKSLILQKLWEYISVAIAAQILVLPITIFFFHKVPTYFILSGLLPVLLSNVAMNLSIALVFLEQIPYLNLVNVYALAPLLKWALYLFIQSVVIIKSLPLNSIDGLTLSNFEFVVFILFLILLMLYLWDRRLLYVFYMTFSLFAIILSVTFRLHHANHQSVLTIYDVNKSGMVDVFDGRRVYHIAIDTLPKSHALFINQNNRFYHFVKDTFTVDMDIDFYHERFQKAKNVFQFKNTKIAVLYDEAQLCNDYTQCDYIITMANLPYNECLKIHDSQHIFIDKSMKYNNLVQWKSSLEAQRIKVHSIKEKGALTINIKT